MSRQTLKEFIEDDWFRNAWLRHPILDIYVRSGNRLISKDRMEHSFEIANVSVRKVKHQGKGNFTKFLGDVEKELIGTKFKIIYIENVFEERFQKFFERRGFEKVLNIGDLVCLQKRINQ